MWTLFPETGTPVTLTYDSRPTDASGQRLIDDHMEKLRQVENDSAQLLHLTPNETPLSDNVTRLLRSPLSERYYFGAEDGYSSVSLGGLTLRGIAEIRDVVLAAEASAARMLKAHQVMLDCLSGVHAMSSVILSTTQPGDMVMTLDPSDGGHSATTGLLARAGRRSMSVPWDETEACVNLDRLDSCVRTNNVRAIYFDVCDHIDAYAVDGIRSVVGPDVTIIYDASHTLGLMMGGQYPNPLPAGADVVVGNTHKTFPGPQKALIAWRTDRVPINIRQAITEDLTSSTHTHHLMALAVAILEFEVFGAAYSRRVLRNSQALAERFVDRGMRVDRARTGERLTRTHQVHLRVDQRDNRRELFERLAKNRISSTLRVGPNGPSYFRLGTQDVTFRGMGSSEMAQIGDLVVDAIQGHDVRNSVGTLVDHFRNVRFTSMFQGLNDGKAGA